MNKITVRNYGWLDNQSTKVRRQILELAVQEGWEIRVQGQKW